MGCSRLSHSQRSPNHLTISSHFTFARLQAISKPTSLFHPRAAHLMTVPYAAHAAHLHRPLPPFCSTTPDFHLVSLDQWFRGLAAAQVNLPKGCVAARTATATQPSPQLRLLKPVNLLSHACENNICKCCTDLMMYAVWKSNGRATRIL